MSFISDVADFFKKPAVIVQHDLHTDDVETSEDFQSVPQANHALVHLLNNQDIIQYGSGFNEYDGKTAKAAVRQKNSYVFHDTDFQVLPLDAIEKK